MLEARLRGRSETNWRRARMKKKARKIEEEEDDDDEEFDEEGGGGVVVGQIPTVSVPRHIKKRALKNKALAVGFSEKDLQDFVTGFHKRKKKRRKEAERQLKEKERLKRIEARKRRKEEKELALYGGILPQPSAPEGEPDDAGSDGGEDESQTAAPISKKTYESDYTTVTVTTSELSREDEDMRPVHPIPKQVSMEEKNHSLSVKKKPLKNDRRHKSQKKARKPASGKKDKRRSKNKR